MDHLTKINEALSKVLPPDQLSDLMAIGQLKTLASGDYFIREGETPQKLAFVLSGLFRYVYVNDKGMEFTKSLIKERDFISSYSAMITQSASHFSIEVLEDAVIYVIPYDKWQKLLIQDPFWTQFLLRFIEKGFMTKEKRERDLLLLHAETRYLNFLEEYPGMDRRIKQTIIASYLGIQPESLSRIRKKMAT
jgi:CRP-like cAMP-binding protein